MTPGHFYRPLHNLRQAIPNIALVSLTISLRVVATGGTFSGTLTSGNRTSPFVITSSRQSFVNITLYFTQTSTLEAFTVPTLRISPVAPVVPAAPLQPGQRAAALQPGQPAPQVPQVPRNDTCTIIMRQKFVYRKLPRVITPPETPADVEQLGANVWFATRDVHQVRN